MSFLAFDALTSNSTFTLGDKIPNIKLDEGKRNRNKKRPAKKGTKPIKIKIKKPLVVDRKPSK